MEEAIEKGLTQPGNSGKLAGPQVTILKENEVPMGCPVLGKP